MAFAYFWPAKSRMIGKRQLGLIIHEFTCSISSILSTISRTYWTRTSWTRTSTPRINSYEQSEDYDEYDNNYLVFFNLSHRRSIAKSGPAGLFLNVKPKG